MVNKCKVSNYFICRQEELRNFVMICNVILCGLPLIVLIMNIDFKCPFDAGLEKPYILAGPCSAESRGQVLATARALADGGVKMFRAGVWKPRTRPGGFEGVGILALEWLAEVKAATGMAVATEVATATHVDACIEAGIDILWIGARTSANPFAVQEIADALERHGVKPAVLVKNPVSPDLNLWIGAVQRVRDAGVERIGVVHRGFSAYGEKVYRNRPHWSIPFELRRLMPGIVMLCDPSHIAGRRDLVDEVARKAMAMNFDGLIIESHCNPDEALSDSAQQLIPADTLSMIAGLRPGRVGDSEAGLDGLRERIDSIDDSLISLLAARMALSDEIGEYKKTHGMSALQPGRYNALMDTRVTAGEKQGLSADFLRRVFGAVHEESVKRQLAILDGNNSK